VESSGDPQHSEGGVFGGGSTGNGFAELIEPKPMIAVCTNGDVRTLEDIERDAIIETLHRFNGHRKKTATALGIGVRTLGLKLRKWKDEHLVDASL